MCIAKWKSPLLIGACLSVSLLGCTQLGETDPDSDLLERAEVSKDGLEVAATRTVDTYDEHFGGNVSAETHYRQVGGDCSENYVRSDDSSAWFDPDNHGIAWYEWNSSDPRDCRATVTIFTHGNFPPRGGWAHARILEEPNPRSRSCVNLCGQQAPTGCYCDNLCELYGDCCDDYQRACR